MRGPRDAAHRGAKVGSKLALSGNAMMEPRIQSGSLLGMDGPRIRIRKGEKRCLRNKQ
jgi:hypothetical protein